MASINKSLEEIIDVLNQV